MTGIPQSEFMLRVKNLRELMKEKEIDVCFIYGDEYRKENLRYISNYWPIFERGAVIITLEGEPIILAAPEGEMVCREMSVWKDLRLVKDFVCVTVPDEIEYPFAKYTNFKDVFDEISAKTKFSRLGIAGIDAMSAYVYDAIRGSIDSRIVLEDVNDLFYKLRINKTENEIVCLKEGGRIADEAYEAMLKAAVSGVTELELMGIAVAEALRQGAEYVPFCLVSSGQRVHTIIGRATDKTIENGDMVMAALAVQYNGYVVTVNFPFVVGEISDPQKELITMLVEAYKIALNNLAAGKNQSGFVLAVKNYFKSKGVSKYDLYPPLHGCGLSEAESPYPNENSTEIFKEGMTINTDISLFGHPGGSNRVESGFVVTKQGYEPMSKLVVNLCNAWIKRGNIDEYIGK